jgi:hypothetical protein
MLMTTFFLPRWEFTVAYTFNDDDNPQPMMTLHHLCKIYVYEMIQNRRFAVKLEQAIPVIWMATQINDDFKTSDNLPVTFFLNNIFRGTLCRGRV